MSSGPQVSPGTASAARRRTLIGAAILLTVLSLSVVRAANQSVVHDEALTYNLLVPRSWNAIRWDFNSNNHTLHTLLVKASTSVFGLSPFTLRLPALLGGLLYLLMAERLCRKACSSTVLYALALLALTTSPFILDYLVVARGYSLALGFLLSALYLGWGVLSDGGGGAGKPPAGRKYVTISVLCALSVASNLSFAFVSAALLGVLWGMAGRRGDSSLPQVSKRALMLVLPGLAVYLVINPGILRLSSRSLFYGAQSWSATYASVVGALFDDFVRFRRTPFVRELLAGGVNVLLLVFGTIALVGLVDAARKRWMLETNGSPKREGPSVFLLFTALVFGLTVALHGLAYALAGVLLPLERTAIFFVPLGALIVVLAAESLGGSALARGVRAFVGAGFAAMVIVFLAFPHTTYFRQWKYDAGSREVFQAINSLAEQRLGRRISIDWLLEPSLNFYRTYFRAESLPRFTREPLDASASIFALLPRRSEEDRRLMTALHLRVVHGDPLSGAVVALQPHRDNIRRGRWDPP